MFEHLGIAPADILLPKCDLSKWSVIACDQHTSEMDYWQSVEKNVDEAPSSLRLILPEAYLEENAMDDSIAKINGTMERYLDQELFQTYENAMVYVEREVSGGAIRRGLVCNVDLENYDFDPEKKAMIRATERTVLERIPPRVRIRENAILELPHIMVLVDDSLKSVVDSLEAKKGSMEKLYGFELMEGGGHIAGWRLTEDAMAQVANTLAFLQENTDMLYAVGDGNHSLAAAKTIYERDKENTPEEEWDSLPSRWALAEIVSLNDPGVQFLPIHRIVVDVDGADMLDALKKRYPGAVVGEGEGHVIGWCCKGQSGSITVPDPEMELAVETLQTFIDDYVKQNGGTVDYIHDIEVVEEMSKQERSIGFLLPEFPRQMLFPYVQKYGTLPRKTFSIGHSNDKRYYLEARMLKR